MIRQQQIDQGAHSGASTVRLTFTVSGGSDVTWTIVEHLWVRDLVDRVAKHFHVQAGSILLVGPAGYYLHTNQSVGESGLHRGEVKKARYVCRRESAAIESVPSFRHDRTGVKVNA